MKAAIISREGLGDGLLMMICAHHLKKAYKVTFFHRLFHELQYFFPGYRFSPLSSIESTNVFSSFDVILIEHYQHPLIEKLIEQRNCFKSLYVIYPTANKKAQKNLSSKDFICNKNHTMAKNLLFFSKKILQKKHLEKTNGIFFPLYLQYQRFSKRIVLHPTSNSFQKNWKKKRFLKLFHLLKKEGFDPIFSLAPHEKHLLENEKVKVIAFSNFHDLASFIFESRFLIGNDSGPAHLASSLNIPSIVIASNKRVMQLWRPDFFKSSLLTAPFFLPNFKGLKIKDRYWASFISTKKVLKTFQKIRKEN